jgi:hypothetical protein
MAIFAPLNVTLTNMQGSANAREDIGDDLIDLSDQTLKCGGLDVWLVL